RNASRSKSLDVTLGKCLIPPWVYLPLQGERVGRKPIHQALGCRSRLIQPVEPDQGTNHHPIGGAVIRHLTHRALSPDQRFLATLEYQIAHADAGERDALLGVDGAQSHRLMKVLD